MWCHDGQPLSESRCDRSVIDWVQVTGAVLQRLARQSVSSSVLWARRILKRQVQLTHLLEPPDLAAIQRGLLLNKHQWFMVCMDHSVAAVKVATPPLSGKEHGIQFTVGH